MQASSSPVLLEHLFRREAGRIVAWLAGLLGPAHLQLAEDATQEAMISALQTWPLQGIPEKPEAWLFRTAHNHALTAVRRMTVYKGKAKELVVALELSVHPLYDLDLEESLQDDELRMIFMCCHPKLAPDARVALSLKLVCGFSTEEIARIFFCEPGAIAQRLVRAKRIIRDQKLNLAMPAKSQIERRLNSVLDVTYAMFTGGYAAHLGEKHIRGDVCMEALRLARLVAASSMNAPRVDALVALMALQASRLPARTDATGELVLLEKQDRRLWDEGLIALGFAYFDRSLAGREISEWHVQAAIASTYASAATSAEIDWAAILEHYNQLMEIKPSAVVELNRTVALMKLRGAAISLAALQPLQNRSVLQKYHLLHAVRGHMLASLDRWDEAGSSFSLALECECSEPEKRFLQRQLETTRLEAVKAPPKEGMYGDTCLVEPRAVTDLTGTNSNTRSGRTERRRYRYDLIF